MTVRRSSGDACGDPSVAVPCAGVEPIPGRFWCSPESSDDDGGLVVSSSRSRRGSADYLVEEEDLMSDGTRARRRLQKRSNQRQAALAWAAVRSPSVSPSVVQAPMASTSIKKPVLEPSTFVLESFDAAEWIQVVRKRRLKISGRGSPRSLPHRRRVRPASLDHAISGYSSCHSLDPYVVMSPAGGAAPGHGFWVQPFGNGCSGFIQPVRLAA